MAQDMKISQMAELETVTGSEEIPVALNGENYKIKSEKLKGADGKTPVLEAGTVTTLEPGQDATASVTANGQDEQGNPKYKIDLGIPQGEPGSSGSVGRYFLGTWTDGELDPDVAEVTGDPVWPTNGTCT